MFQHVTLTWCHTLRRHRRKRPVSKVSLCTPLLSAPATLLPDLWAWGLLLPRAVPGCPGAALGSPAGWLAQVEEAAEASGSMDS